jgi:hypothetical protein
MILYYAAGGGLGHLTRGRALLHTLGVTGPLAFMTASRFAHDPRVRGDAEVVAIPPALAHDPAAYRRWLIAEIGRLAPEEIYIDTFPAGILGEFAGFPFLGETRLHHVARLLRWSAYAALDASPPPSFTTTWRVEPLDPAQELALGEVSSAMLSLELRDPPHEPLPDAIHSFLDDDPAPLWLVVHSEPGEEIAELLAYAHDLAAAERAHPRIVLVTRSSPHGLSPSIPVLDLYPATSLFPHAAMIITGCGFNAMRQTLPYRERHRFLPFPRRYDDQFLRAARRREM